MLCLYHFIGFCCFTLLSMDASASRATNQQEGFVFPLIYSNFDSLCVDALACSVERLSLTTDTATPRFPNQLYGLIDPVAALAQFNGNNQYLSSFEDVKALLVSLIQPHGQQQQHQYLGKPQVIEMILWQVKYHLCDLMMDQHCSPLIEKIFEASSLDHITRILALVVRNEEKFKQVCMHNNGTLVMKKLLECLKTPEQIFTAIYALKSITVGLSKIINGGRIIMHCFKLFSPAFTSFIIDEVAANCVEIVVDNIGCCIYQKYLRLIPKEATRPMIEGIATYAWILTAHPFGNYVVQCIVKMKIPYINAAIVSQLKGRFAPLSVDKYASNVVECLLEFAEERETTVMIEEIIYSPDFVPIVQDICGHYVVQRALKNCKGTLYKILAGRVFYNYPSLCDHVYGKKVVAIAQRLSNKKKPYR